MVQQKPLELWQVLLIAAHWRAIGVVAERLYRVQEHGLSPSSTTPMFWQGGRPTVALPVDCELAVLASSGKL